MSFCNNEFHAYTAAASSVLFSRRGDFILECNPIMFALERGDIVHVDAQGYNLYGMVLFRRFNRQANVEVAIRRFVPSDFAWRPSPEEAVIPLASDAAKVPAPLTATITVDSESRLSVLEWIMDEDKILNVTGFNIEASNDAGTSWRGISQVGPEARSLERTVGLDAHSIQYRVQTLAGRRDSDWVETESLVITASLAEEGPPGLPGLVQFQYNNREENPKNPGEYTYVGAPLGSWDNLKGNNVSAVRMHVIDQDGEDQRLYLNNLKEGDLQVFLDNENKWVARKIIATPNYTYSIVSGLPAGMVFNPETRRIVGVPTETGTFDVVYRVEDAYGGVTDKTETIVIE